MENDYSKYKLLDPQPKFSIFEKVVRRFGQDYDVYGAGVLEDLQIIYNSISDEERDQLVEGFRKFLVDHLNKEPADILEAWYECGAQYWPPDLDIKTTLPKMLLIFEGKKKYQLMKISKHYFSEIFNLSNSLY